MTTQTAARLKKIVDEMSGMFYERESTIRSLVVTMLARQHSLLLGPPGAAKSELARELTSRISGGTYWEILLSKFTTPPQIFGPVDVAALTSTGEFRQVFDGHATEAHIGFIDEIFKCGDAALNSMLSFLNERRYHPEAGGAPVSCPLISAVCASNELAQTDALDALFERLLVRIEVSYIADPSNFAAFLGSAVTTGARAARTTVDLDDLQAAVTAEVPAIAVGDGVIDAICTLRGQLRRQELVASDRRWKQGIRLLQASAYLAGRDEVSTEDMVILASVLWEQISQRPAVEREVLAMVNPDAREALDLLDAINELAAELDAMALPGPGAHAAPAGVLSQVSGPAAPRAWLPGGLRQHLAAARPAPGGVLAADRMPALAAGSRAQHAPAGVVLQDPLPAAPRALRFRGGLADLPPAAAAVVQAIEHRHPPRPRPGGVSALAEADMQLAERATAEVHVRPVQQRGLLRPQARVIQGAEQRIVPGRRRVLPRGGDPGLQELEELADPLRRWGRQLGRRVIADMAGGVELIDRADQPHAERGLDLGGLTGLQEPVEALEDLHILAAGRRGPPGCRELADHPVDVFGRHLPGRAAQRPQRPLQLADVVVDRDPAEPTRSPRRHERVDARSLELPRIHRERPRRDRPALQHPQPRRHRHTFLAPERLRWRLTYGTCASKIGKHAGTARSQAPGRIGQPEQVPAPDRWGEVFGDDVVAAAMIDRLVHHAEVIALKGDSYRLKDRDLGRVPAAPATDD